MKCDAYSSKALKDACLLVRSGSSPDKSLANEYLKELGDLKLLNSIDIVKDSSVIKADIMAKVISTIENRGYDIIPYVKPHEVNSPKMEPRKMAVTDRETAKQNSQASGAATLLGGSMLGASLAGTPGALIGAFLGALVASQRKQ